MPSRPTAHARPARDTSRVVRLVVQQWALWLACLAISVIPARPADQQLLENQVKGAFLVKFAMFVEWPESTFSSSQSPIVIGIIGDDPFGPQYESALKKEVANGHPFVLKRFKDVQELSGCQILFISSSENRRLPEIIAAARKHATLTVGDQERFAQRGGMINLVKEAGKMRFEVNTAAVDASGLKMSAKLLQVAKQVTPDPVKGEP